jgi:hypothetical protein
MVGTAGYPILGYRSIICKDVKIMQVISMPTNKTCSNQWKPSI